MRTAAECRAMARDALSGVTPMLDPQLKAALQRSAEDWTALALLIEFRDGQHHAAPH